MTQLERLLKLNEYLLNEVPQYREQAENFDKDEASQFRLFRSLVNIREPQKADKTFLQLQNEYLQSVALEKGIVNINELSSVMPDIYLWQGDITRLECGAIVNAANSGMTGCYYPCHSCIDNAIHTFDGIQQRFICNEIMQKQGYEEPTGKAKITPAFNLPCKNIIHTVGPIVHGRLTQKHCELLASCYLSCLTLADKYQIDSIAFCCISTGEFHFPNEKAAHIALETVLNYKNKNHSKVKVIFNVFKQIDYDIYRKLFEQYRET